MLSYLQRAKKCTNPTAKRLLQLMETKDTNLSVSADFTSKTKVLELADIVGPEICVLKTHIDILEDFDFAFIEALKQLAQKHDFIIFEDRKFADIGNTVKLQYEKGIYHIADWAPITNAHTVPGPGIIEGLKAGGLLRGNGLLLLAEMSSKDNLAHGSYTQATLRMAKAHSDFVIGFISQHQLLDDPQFIYFTPGVSMSSQQDNLGQQYITPHQAIFEQKNDVIIVGRGIYAAENPQKMAQEYREAGWEAYQQKLKIL